MDGPGLISVDNETISQSYRVTKEGKKYTYKLHVLQQPSRARACGSGAKSSADRRPVDPPPIVEFKVFEGEGNDSELKDVTFAMNSSYILYVQLEHARNLASGRGQQDQKSHLAICGQTVAGVVYLDRPSPAGYFIFPDLSVRHEGKYRLIFSLFEEIKDKKDEDNSTDVVQLGTGEYLTHRLEVRSQPFTVYSAKKFPGLTESTTLSRMVAEQGCRVRIRRDVRMRRRDVKSGKDWEGYEDETAEMRTRMSATPDPSAYPGLSAGHGYEIPRPRSGSNASHHSLAPSLSMSRRPSLQDINQAHRQSAYSLNAQTPQSAYPQSSPYGPGPSPAQHFQQSPFVQQVPTMQPPPPQFSQTTYQPPTLPAPGPTPQPYFGYTSVTSPQSYAQSQYASSPNFETGSQRASMDYSNHMSLDHRRSSSFYGSSSSTLPSSQSQTHYQMSQAPVPVSHHHQSSYGSMDTYNNRPVPIEPLQPPTRATGATTPLPKAPSFTDKLPPLSGLSTTGNKHIEPSSPSAYAGTNTTYYPANQTPLDSNKRMFGQVFNDRHLNQPLRQGARPPTTGLNQNSLAGMCEVGDDDEPELDLESAMHKMRYRRADGRQISRNLPPTHG